MKDRWTELCESAVTELDRTRFRAILQELNELLDECGSLPCSRQTPRLAPARPSERDVHSQPQRLAK